MRRRLTSWLSAAVGTGLPAALTLGLLAGVTMFAAVAGPRQSLSVRTRALQRMFTATAPAQRSVQATADSAQAETTNGSPLAFDQVTTATARSPSGQRVGAAKPSRCRCPAVRRTGPQLSTAYNPVIGAAQSAFDQPGVGPQIELTLPSLARPPGGLPSRPGRVQLAGPGQPRRWCRGHAATAARFSLQPGSHLTLSLPSGTNSGGYRHRPPGPARPSILDPGSRRGCALAQPAAARGAPYWLGAAFVAPGELAGLQTCSARRT